MFNKILVPLDGSSLAESALPIAIELAKIHHAKLILLRVAEGKPTFMENALGSAWIAELDRIRADQAESVIYLENLMKTQPQLDGIAQTMVKVGSAASEIIHITNREKIDLIVMSTHGRTGILDLIMGSIAKKVVADSPCPVMLI